MKLLSLFCLLLFSTRSFSFRGETGDMKIEGKKKNSTIEGVSVVYARDIQPC